jgi:hypothetical protein
VDGEVWEGGSWLTAKDAERQRTQRGERLLWRKYTTLSCFSGWLLFIGAIRSGQDPAVKRVLEQLAREETQHAALAWKIFSWLSGELAQVEAMIFKVDAGDSPDLPWFGVQGKEARQALYQEVIREVILPAASAAVGGGVHG